METIKFNELIEMLNSSTPKKIGILDNNTISFLAKIDKYSYTDKVLVNYDMLLIPNWVYEEVKDSEERIRYVEKILNTKLKSFIKRNIKKINH